MLSMKWVKYAKTTLMLVGESHLMTCESKLKLSNRTNLGRLKPWIKTKQYIELKRPRPLIRTTYESRSD